MDAKKGAKQPCGFPHELRGDAEDVTENEVLGRVVAQHARRLAFHGVEERIEVRGIERRQDRPAQPDEQRVKPERQQSPGLVGVRDDGQRGRCRGNSWRMRSRQLLTMAAQAYRCRTPRRSFSPLSKIATRIDRLSANDALIIFTLRFRAADRYLLTRPLSNLPILPPVPPPPPFAAKPVNNTRIATMCHEMSPGSEFGCSLDHQSVNPTAIRSR